MILHDVQQGTPEWHALRAGIPTSSHFSEILTAGGKPSRSADKLIGRCLFFWATGEPTGSASSSFMERGLELEEEAIGWYEITRQVDVERVGFVTTDDGWAGCSPDGLLNDFPHLPDQKYHLDSGGLEVKCPSAEVFMLASVNPDAYAATHKQQIQGNLWITKRKWWDLLVFNPHPKLDPVVVRVQRDVEYIELLRSAVHNVSAAIVDGKRKLGLEPLIPVEETL